MKKIDILKFVIFIIIVVAAIWLIRHYHLMHRLILLENWIRTNGVLGATVFILIFGVAFSFGVPTIALTVFAGTIYGTFTGMVTASLGSTLGIIIIFLLTRFLARDLFIDLLGKKKLFIKIDALTEKFGWYLVAIIRFVPLVPAEIVNYGFGLTKIKFLPYVFWSWLCMLPWLFIYIAGTDAYMDYKTDHEIPWVLIGPSVGMIILLIFAGIKFMKLIEPEMKKKDKSEK
ncbi:MAG: TVP38/TMEM64 family protein [bacterium]